MQLFSHQRCFIVHCFVIAFLVCLIPNTNAYATETSVIHNIHIKWNYDNPQNIPLSGFHLYQENTSICHTTNPAERSMDCEFKSPTGTFHFYLTAYSEERESPLSDPFLFTLQTPADHPVAEISANVAPGAISSIVTLDAGDSQGNIKKYLWSFGDGSSKKTRQSTITHTYNSTGKYTASVTVIGVNRKRDKKSIIINTTPQEIPPDLEAPVATIRTSGNNGSAPFSISFDGLESIAGNGDITNYIWNFGDESPRTQQVTPVHTYSIPGIYHPTLTVVNSQGIHHTTSVTIVVTVPSPGNEIPHAHFTTSLIQLDDTLIIEFDASASVDTDGYVSSYVWNFGNSGFQTGPYVTHTFPANKVSSITLTVTDDTGAQHTRTSSTITFLKEIHGAVIYLINSFLLNNDPKG